MKTILVQQGECLASIAFEHGFFIDTIWDDSTNRELREQRSSPYILMPGDVVHVPDLRPKTVPVTTGSVHRFRRRGVPEQICLRFESGAKARAGVPYVLTIDGTSQGGITGEDGGVRHYLPPNAESVELTLRPEGSPEERYVLAVRELDPVMYSSGVQARLRSLGLYHGAADGELNEATRAALAAFQAAQGLDATGEPDDATRAALVAAYGR